MGKYKIPKREPDVHKKLSEEIKTLRKLVKYLRKELARANNDVNRFDNLREELNEIDFKEKQKDETTVPTRKCYTCNEGTLQLVIYERRDGMMYQRRCSKCKYATRIKKYTKDVKE